jgi:hypothetical protein
VVAVIGLLVAFVVVLLLAWALSLQQSPPDTAQQRAAVGLHTIHCRLEVAQFRTEAQADAAAMRRALRRALDEQEQP